MVLTEAPFWAEVAAIPSTLHALIGRYVIIGAEWSQGIEPLATTQTGPSAEVDGTQTYGRHWVAAHGN